MITKFQKVFIPEADSLEGLHNSVRVAVDRLVTQLNSAVQTKDLDVNNNRIINVAWPSDQRDAVSLEYLEHLLRHQKAKKPNVTPGQNLPIIVGTGSPEGVVVADIGWVFLRLDGDQGTSIYFKTRDNALSTGWLSRAQYHQLQIQNTHPSTGFTWLRVTASSTTPQGTNPLQTWEDSGGGIIAQVFDTGRGEFKALGINLTKPSTDGHLRLSTFLGVNTNTPIGTEKVNVTGDSILNGNCVFGGTTLTGGYAETHHGATEFKANVDIINGTASRAVILNANKTIAVSATTSTELGYVNGVTSAIQAQLDGKPAKGTPGAHTITLIKLTGGGTDGSITWNADGVITAYVDPT